MSQARGPAVGVSPRPQGRNRLTCSHRSPGPASPPVSLGRLPTPPIREDTDGAGPVRRRCGRAPSSVPCPPVIGDTGVKSLLGSLRLANSFAGRYGPGEWTCGRTVPVPSRRRKETTRKVSRPRHHPHGRATVAPSDSRVVADSRRDPPSVGTGVDPAADHSLPHYRHGAVVPASATSLSKSGRLHRGPG